MYREGKALIQADQTKWCTIAKPHGKMGLTPQGEMQTLSGAVDFQAEIH